ncbi:hypothetical protein FS749_004808, partial [Ceratobasidium sp. UAMH 11750]
RRAPGAPGPPRKKRKPSRKPPGAEDDEGRSQAPESEDEDQPRDPAIPHQAEEADAAIEQAVLYMEREVAGGGLPPTSDLRRIASQIQAARLGGAYLTGYGVGHVDGLVNLEQNPNSRANPHHLDPLHVQKLAEAFLDPSTMRDWETPIYIMVPGKMIEEQCLERIRACESRSPGGDVPALTLVHPHNDEIASLEFACEYYQQGKSSLAEGDLPPKRERLHELRSARPKATLINGNHRIAALKLMGSNCSRSFKQVVVDLRTRRITAETAEALIQGIAKRAKLARYRVEVYDEDKMTEELLTWLSRNDESRISKGMEAGEKTWWLANQFDSWLKKAQEHGLGDSPDRYNAAHSDWLKTLAPPSEAAGPSESRASKKAGSGRRGDWAGPEAVSRLLTEPLTTRMVLDTRHASVVYQTILKSTLASHLLHDASAVVTCRVWLSMRVLLNVFDVSQGDGFAEAEAYLQSHAAPPPLHGDEDAVPLWRQLHSRPEKRPQYVSEYDAGMQKKFDALYLDALRDFRTSHRDIDWDEGPAIERMRRLFHEFGLWIREHDPSEPRRCLALSVLLFSRLPLAEEEQSQNSAVFFASAALPAPRWIASALDANSSFNTDARLLALEYTLDALLPIWTLGAQTVGKSSNHSQWYQRSRGYAQVPMLLLDSPGEATVEHRLHASICFLSDIRLRNALSDFQDRCGTEVKSLLASCSVNKSSSARIPILTDIAQEDPETFGSESELHQAVTRARQSLHAIASGPNFPPPQELSKHMSQFTSLQRVIPAGFWHRFPCNDWLSGWSTASSRRFQNVNSLVGWAIFIARLSIIVEDHLNGSLTSRHLLALSQSIGQYVSDRAWGGHLNVVESECPSPPATPGRRLSSPTSAGAEQPGEPTQSCPPAVTHAADEAPDVPGVDPNGDGQGADHATKAGVTGHQSESGLEALPPGRSSTKAPERPATQRPSSPPKLPSSNHNPTAAPPRRPLACAVREALALKAPAADSTVDPTVDPAPLEQAPDPRRQEKASTPSPRLHQDTPTSGAPGPSATPVVDQDGDFSMHDFGLSRSPPTSLERPAPLGAGSEYPTNTSSPLAHRELAEAPSDQPTGTATNPAQDPATQASGADQLGAPSSLGRSPRSPETPEASEAPAPAQRPGRSPDPPPGSDRLDAAPRSRSPQHKPPGTRWPRVQKQLTPDDAMGALRHRITRGRAWSPTNPAPSLELGEEQVKRLQAGIRAERESLLHALDHASGHCHIAHYGPRFATHSLAALVEEYEAVYLDRIAAVFQTVCAVPAAEAVQLAKGVMSEDPACAVTLADLEAQPKRAEV